MGLFIYVFVKVLFGYDGVHDKPKRDLCTERHPLEHSCALIYLRGPTDQTNLHPWLYSTY